ncbi:unnamed protein product [Enterobius vermicularis]|uniref:Uncharacterized protein n=1 Tax=Enterobius vermicularis TaxID=51028 RepID=A0A0N4VQS5_ENTVE|nr:unnamed protein product [Enterobius vermicularis]
MHLVFYGPPNSDGWLKLLQLKFHCYRSAVIRYDTNSEALNTVEENSELTLPSPGIMSTVCHHPTPSPIVIIYLPTNGLLELIAGS